MKKLFMLALSVVAVSAVAEAQRANVGSARAGVTKGVGVTAAQLNAARNTGSANTNSAAARPAELQETPQQVIVQQTAETIQPAGLVGQEQVVAQINYVNEALVKELEEKTALRDQLKLEIAQIEAEQTRCDKQRKGWIAATVIGGVGTVATTVGVAVQAKKLNEKKDALNGAE